MWPPISNFGDVWFEIEVTGISLCRAAIGTAESENSTKTDKEERQTVSITAWRFVFLNDWNNSTLLKGRILRFLVYDNPHETQGFFDGLIITMYVIYPPMIFSNGQIIGGMRDSPLP